MLVRDILDNEEFKKMGDIEHHNSTRLDHLMKVSVEQLLHLN